MSNPNAQDPAAAAPSTGPPSLTAPTPTPPRPGPPHLMPSRGSVPRPNPSGGMNLRPNLSDGTVENKLIKVGGDVDAKVAKDPATQPPVVEEDKGDGGEIHPRVAPHEKNRGLERMDQPKNTHDFTTEPKKEPTFQG